MQTDVERSEDNGSRLAGARLDAAVCAILRPLCLSLVCAFSSRERERGAMASESYHRLRARAHYPLPHPLPHPHQHTHTQARRYILRHARTIEQSTVRRKSVARKLTKVTTEDISLLKSVSSQSHACARASTSCSGARSTRFGF